MDYQAAVCLTHYEACLVFQAPQWKRRLPQDLREPSPRSLSGAMTMALVVLIILALTLAAAAFLLNWI
jgi:hypothetical protein